MSLRSTTVALAALAATAVAARTVAGEIRGRALLGTNRPAAGVAVSVLPFEDGLAAARREARGEALPKPLATATTRGDGAFTVALPASAPAGAVVRLAFGGGAAAPVVLDRLLDAAGEDAGDVRLPKAQALAGRVTDERGGPVVGATVTLWPGRARGILETPGLYGVAQTATTKPDGTFRFEVAAEDGNRLRVEAPAMATVEREGVRAGALARPVTMTVGQVRRGSVTLPDRRTGAGGALLRFEGRTRTRWVETRPDGTFVLDGAPREAGTLVADAGDRGRGTAPVAAGAASEPVTIALAATALLSGRVVDQDTARPIAGVRLVARGADGSSFLARSGADGRYALRGLPPQAYRLVAEDDRYVTFSRNVTVAAGSPEAQDVPLVRAATLVGRVVSEEGAPIEGATVTVSPSGENVFASFVRRFEGEAEVRTGRDGVFKAARLRPGDGQRVDVRHEDFEERSVAGIALAPGATRSGFTVVMRRGLVLRGIAKNEEGRPLAGVEVTLSATRSLRAGRGGMQISMIGPGSQVRRETGADGRFEFRGLKKGEYALSARRAGLGRASLDPVNVAETGVEPVTLVLRPGATVTGLVHDRGGAGAPGWYVSARAAGQGGPALGPDSIRTEEATGPDGVFVLEGLTGGETYDLQVMGPAGLGPRKAGVVAPADGVDFAVNGTGQIRGRVVDAESGKPVPDFEVRYAPDAQGGMRFVMRMGPGRQRGPLERQSFHADDGAFALDDVPSGRWTVEAFASGYQSGSAAGVTVAEGDAAEGVEVRLSRGSVVSGRVLESRSGRPVLGSTVRAEQAGGEGRMMVMRMGSEGGELESLTDADGRYEIAGLAPGGWTLTATHPDWSEATTRVEIKDAPAVADIRVGRGGAVAGTVLAGGRPVGGAQVALQVAGDSGFRMSPGFMGGGEQSALSDEGGRFRFERLSPGRYSVVASLRDQTSAPAEAVVTGDDAQEVQLALAEGARVRGVVSGLPEAQLSGVRVSAQGGDYFASTSTGAGGTFELTGVPEGPLDLRASAGDFVIGSSRSASTTVTIGPGQAEATAEIVFEAGFRVDGHVTRGGRPVVDATVMANPESGGGRATATGRTDEVGRLRSRGPSGGDLLDHRHEHRLGADPEERGDRRRHDRRPRGAAREDQRRRGGGGGRPAAVGGRRAHRGRWDRHALRDDGHDRQLRPLLLRGPRAARVPRRVPEGRVPGRHARAGGVRGGRRARRAAARRGNRHRGPRRDLRDAAARALRAGRRRLGQRGVRGQRVARQRRSRRGAGAQAGVVRAAGGVVRLRAGARSRRGALAHDPPHAHARWLARDPGRPADAGRARAVRAPPRRRRAAIPAERLLAGRAYRPRLAGAPSRERRARPLRARGAGRPASRRDRHRGRPLDGRAALGLFRPSAGGPAACRRRAAPRPARSPWPERRPAPARGARAVWRSRRLRAPAPPSGRHGRPRSAAACPADTRRAS